MRQQLLRGIVCRVTGRGIEREVSCEEKELCRSISGAGALSFDEAKEKSEESIETASSPRSGVQD